MARVIRPIGRVTKTLADAGYRQYAAIFEDDVQVANVSVLSIMSGKTIKFVGAYMDGNGELHTTNQCMDMKRAARRILAIRADMLKEDDLMIDCKGCGTRHADCDMCPE